MSNPDYSLSKEISLRDYFAAAALNYIGPIVLIALKADKKVGEPERVATMCYELADALLKERDKE